MQIVHFHCAQHFEVASFDELVLRIICTDLEETVEVFFVHEANDLLCDPLEARCDELDGFPTLAVVPARRKEVSWNLQIHSLTIYFPQTELLLAVVEIELVLEIGGEEVGYRC